MSRKTKFAKSNKLSKMVNNANIVKVREKCKNIIKHPKLHSIEDILYAIKKMQQISKFSITKYRKCCEITGRQRGITPLGISRIMFREYALKGELLGIEKHSNK